MGFGDITNCFSEIASAIRSKTGGSGTYTPSQMARTINMISTEGNTTPYGIQTDNASEYVNTNISSVTTSSRINRQKANTFNQPVTISNNVVNAHNMFNGCQLFNQPVTIPNSVVDASNMFNNCHNFNQPITIPNSVTNTHAMFYNCYNFNQPVNIPNGVTNAARMFYNCYDLNQPVTIPNNVTNASSMFANCTNFNKSVTIGYSVTNTHAMFYNCSKFNQPITIPNSVTNAWYMFYNCKNMMSNIKILRTPTTTLYAAHLVGLRNTQKRINIYHPGTNDKLLECYNNNTSSTIWKENTSNKCRYNTALNIYIYYGQEL